jgi:hypothetical protein
MAWTCPECQFGGNADDRRGCAQCGRQRHDAVPPEEQARIATSAAPLAGQLTWTETTTESMSTDWWCFGSLLLMMMILLPVFAVVFIGSLFMSIAFSMLGWHGAARSFGPPSIMEIIQSLGIVRAIMGDGKRSQVPAMRLTITNQGGERLALIKGELTAGTFRRGDALSLQGSWRNGTLLVTQGFNHTLGSSIMVRRNLWREVFFLLLLILLVLVTAGVTH